MEILISFFSTILLMFDVPFIDSGKADIHTSPNSVEVTIKDSDNSSVLKANTDGNIYFCCIQTDDTDYLH